MSRTLLFFLAIVVFVFWLNDFVSTGRFLAMTDAHPGRRGTATALFYLGRANEILNDDKDALEYYRRVVDRYPKSRYGLEAQYGVASSYERMKLYRQSMDEYVKFLEKYPNSHYDTSVRNNVEMLKAR